MVPFLLWIFATGVTFGVIRTVLRNPKRELIHPRIPVIVTLWLTALSSILWAAIVFALAWILEFRRSPPT